MEYKIDRFATTPGNFLLSGGDVVGTLLPGTYELEHLSGISNAVGGIGSFLYELRMTSFTDGPNHVPDAGSTVTLLGMALGGLGFFIRQRI
jgi:hypothetical protein